MSSADMLENVRIPKNVRDPHFKTRLSFAEWRINELQKPQPAGIVNETIASIIELVNGILGQYYNRDSENKKKFDEGGVMMLLKEKIKELGGSSWGWNTVYKLLMILLLGAMLVFVLIINVIRWGVSIFTSSFIQFDRPQKMFGNYEKVIVPLIIYGFFIALTSYNFNIYRLLALLLVYIISYSELKYLGFILIFVLSIGIEIVLLIFN